MDQSLAPDLFPSGFPSELASAAFVSSNEAAWRPALAARAVEWLASNGYAVLGTELWLPHGGLIQSLLYFQNVDRKGNEAWDSFVSRAAAETLAYLIAFSPIVHQGRRCLCERYLGQRGGVWESESLAYSKLSKNPDITLLP